jgi:hypothetical protein
VNRHIRNLALSAVGAAALVIPTGAVLAATPVQNGCPASGTLISVAYLESQGDYHVPGRIDDPANGGNGDGWVCAFLLPDAVADAWGSSDPIYMFFENNLPAQGRP